MALIDFDPEKTPTSTTPADTSASAEVSREDILGTTLLTNGWRLIKKGAEYGAYIYAAREVTPAQKKYLQRYFNCTSNSLEGYAFNFQGDFTVAEFTVYKFLDKKGSVCINDYSETVLASGALAYFGFLLDLINHHQSECREDYMALNCLCPRNMYSTPGPSGSGSCVWLLPLPALHPGDSPAVPSDAFENTASVSMDLYAAAYTYIQLKHNNFETAPLENEQQIIDKLSSCLLPFAFLRPSLATLLELFSDHLPKGSTNVIGHTPTAHVGTRVPPGGKASPVPAEDQSRKAPTEHTYEEGRRHPDPDHGSKKGRSLLDGLKDGLKRLVDNDDDDTPSGTLE